MRDDGPDLPQEYRDLWVSLGARLSGYGAELGSSAINAKSYEELCVIRGRCRAVEDFLHLMSQMEISVGVNPRGEVRSDDEHEDSEEERRDA